MIPGRPSDAAARTTYKFDGFTDKLQLVIGEVGASIYVEGPDGDVWDIIFDVDVVAVPVDGGVCCQFCTQNENVEIFHDAMALYDDHVFGPLSTWYAEELSTATHLKLEQLKGSRWAEMVTLSVEEPGTPTLIPLRG